MAALAHDHLPSLNEASFTHTGAGSGEGGVGVGNAGTPSSFPSASQVGGADDAREGFDAVTRAMRMLLAEGDAMAEELATVRGRVADRVSGASFPVRLTDAAEGDDDYDDGGAAYSELIASVRARSAGRGPMRGSLGHESAVGPPSPPLPSRGDRFPASASPSLPRAASIPLMGARAPSGFHYQRPALPNGAEHSQSFAYAQGAGAGGTAAPVNSSRGVVSLESEARMISEALKLLRTSVDAGGSALASSHAGTPRQGAYYPSQQHQPTPIPMRDLPAVLFANPTSEVLRHGATMASPTTTAGAVVNMAVSGREYSLRSLRATFTALDESRRRTEQCMAMCDASAATYASAMEDLRHGWAEEQRLWKEDEALLMRQLAEKNVPIPPLV